MITEREITTGETVDDNGRRVLVTKDLAEWNLLAHHRGWCHNMVACPTCQASLSHVRPSSGERRLQDAALSAVRAHPDRPISAIRALRQEFPGLGLIDARDQVERVTGVRIGR